MNILLALIPISLLLLLLAVAAFRWAVRHRQFEDLEAAALDVLREDHGPDPRPPRILAPGDAAANSATSDNAGPGHR